MWELKWREREGEWEKKLWVQIKRERNWGDICNLFKWGERWERKKENIRVQIKREKERKRKWENSNEEKEIKEGSCNLTLNFIKCNFNNL